MGGERKGETNDETPTLKEGKRGNGPDKVIAAKHFRDGGKRRGGKMFDEGEGRNIDNKKISIKTSHPKISAAKNHLANGRKFVPLIHRNSFELRKAGRRNICWQSQRRRTQRRRWNRRRQKD